MLPDIIRKNLKVKEGKSNYKFGNEVFHHSGYTLSGQC